MCTAWSNGLCASVYKILSSVCGCILAPVEKPKAFDCTLSIHYRPHDVLEKTQEENLGDHPQAPSLTIQFLRLTLTSCFKRQWPCKQTTWRQWFLRGHPTGKRGNWLKEKQVHSGWTPPGKTESQGLEFNFSGNDVILLSSESLFTPLYFAHIILKSQFLISDYLTRNSDLLYSSKIRVT